MIGQNIIWCIFLCAIPQTLVFGRLYGHKRCLKKSSYEHPKDCDKFYSCAAFGPVLMHCSAGLHFNPQYLFCDWPEKAGCKGAIIEDTGNEFHQSCPIYPDLEDCSKFYLCSSSGLRLVQCPKGLYFNPQLLVCDWPQNVECIDPNAFPNDANTITKKPTINPVMTSENKEDISDGTPTLDMPRTTQSTTSLAHQPDSAEHNITEITTTKEAEPSTITEATAGSTQTQNVSIKPNLATLCKNNIWPSLGNCSKFFMCSSTGAVEKSCPEGLLFNSVLLVCDWPYNVECEENTNLIPEINTTEHISEASTTNLIPDFSEMETSYQSTFDIEATYFETTSLEDLSTTTTENILSTNSNKEATTNPEGNITTEIGNVTIHGLETTIVLTETTTPLFENNRLCEGSIWPNPKNCTSFFMCSSTGAVEKSCPEGLLFNSVLLVCDWPYTVECEKNTNYIPEISTTEHTLEASTTTLSTGFSDGETTSYRSALDIEAAHSETNSLEDLSTTTMENILYTNANKETTTNAEENITTEISSVTTHGLETTIVLTETITPLFENNRLCEGSIWPNPKNCTNFFMCGSTGAVEKSCPEGLLFNSLLLVCDWPYNVECEKNTNLIPEISTTEHTSEASTTTLSTGLWDGETTSYQSTWDIEAAHFETTSLEDLKTTTTENILSTNANKETTTNSEENVTTEISSVPTHGLETTIVLTETTTPLFENNRLCEGSIWPNPKNCTNFFMCSSTTGAVEKSCPEGLLFNSVLLVCDWSYNVECEENTNLVPEISTKEHTSEGSTTTLLTGLSDGETTSYQSTWDIEAAHFETTPLEDLSTTTTENILSTNANKETTTNAEENVITEISSVTTRGLETTIVLTEATTKIFENLDNSSLCEGCVWPNPKNCTQFFMCDSTGAVEKSCPKGLLFNSILLVCDWPYNVECGENTNLIPEISTTEHTSEASTTTLSTNFSEIETTSYQSSLHIETTSLENIDTTATENILSTNANTETMTNTETTTTELTTSTGILSTTMDYISESTTDTFETTPIDRTTLEQDIAAEKRNTTGMTTQSTSTEYKINVLSFEDNLSTNAITENFGKSTTENVLISTSDLNTEITGYSISTAEENIIKKPSNISQNLEPVAESASQGGLCTTPIWPNPDDCRTFFMCGSAGIVELSCPEGLHFNPILLVCDWTKNVRCTSNLRDEKLVNSLLPVSAE